MLLMPVIVTKFYKLYKGKKKYTVTILSSLIITETIIYDLKFQLCVCSKNNLNVRISEVTGFTNEKTDTFNNYVF